MFDACPDLGPTLNHGPVRGVVHAVSDDVSPFLVHSAHFHDISTPIIRKTNGFRAADTSFVAELLINADETLRRCSIVTLRHEHVIVLLGHIVYRPTTTTRNNMQSEERASRIKKCVGFRQKGGTNVRWPRHSTAN